jgi:hypothetical protein
MDAPARGALTLVRLIGVTLVVASILELGLYFAECRAPRHPRPVEVAPVLVRLIWAVAGFVILILARRIAAWLSDWLDL